MSGMRAARASAPAPGAERVLFVSGAPDPALVAATSQAGHSVATASTPAELGYHLDHLRPTCVLMDMDEIEAIGGARALFSSGSRSMRRLLLAGPAAFFVGLRWVAERRADHVLMTPARPEDVLVAVGASAAALRLPSLDRIQWEYIQAVLGSCQGNVSEAARQLGMFRQSLQRILRRNAPRS
jgi:ActR/RegA family two-component response regulator